MPVHVNKSGNYVPMLAKSCPGDYPGGYPKSCSYVLAGVFLARARPKHFTRIIRAPATHIHTRHISFTPPALRYI